MRFAGGGGRGRNLSRDYVVEKLTTTLRCLATHRGDARARIIDCYLCFHALREEDFPEELRGDWRWIMTTITKVGPMVAADGRVLRGSVETTMRASKNVTAAKVAERLWTLYWAVSSNTAYE